MPATQLGAVPQNQLDALPLQSAQAAASGGTLTLAFGRVTRFWDEVTLGISAANFVNDGNGNFVLVSNFISTFGCRSFSVLFRRTNAGVGLALGAIQVRIQYRISATDVPPTSLGAGAFNLDYTGSMVVANSSVVFPLMQAAGEVQRICVGWDNGLIPVAANAPNASAFIGDNVRLYFQSGGANPGVANLFSASLWGTG